MRHLHRLLALLLILSTAAPAGAFDSFGFGGGGFGFGKNATARYFAQYLTNGLDLTVTSGPIYTADNLGVLRTAGSNQLAMPGWRLSFSDYEGVTSGPDLFNTSVIDMTTNGSVVGSEVVLAPSNYASKTFSFAAGKTYQVVFDGIGVVRSRFNSLHAYSSYRSLPRTDIFTATDQNLVQITSSGETRLAAITVKEIAAGWLPTSPITVAVTGDSIADTPIPYLATALPATTFDESLSGQMFSWVAATGMPAAVATGAKNILIHCGVNDISNGRTWTQVEADLDTIAGLLQPGQKLFIDEILPWTNGTDEQNATARQWNGYFALWCMANNATLIESRAYLGKIRASTGEYDDLYASYDSDGLHLNLYGDDRLGKAWAAAIAASYGIITGDQIFTSTLRRTRTGIVTDRSVDADFRGPLVFPARTNYFLNSEAPVTQNITTTAQKYAVSVEGTGSVTLSGTATGTALAGSPLVVTATAGTLTVTVTGTPTHVQVEAGDFHTTRIPTTVAPVLRPATVLSGTTAGKIRANDFAIDQIVIPWAGGQDGTWGVSTQVDGTNYTGLYIRPTVLQFCKVIAGSSTKLVSVNYTHAANVPFQYQAYQSSVYGMGIRVRQYTGGTWGAWSAWATKDDADGMLDAPIAATMQIGARNGANQFAGTYPMFLSVLHMDPKAKLEEAAAAFDAAWAIANP